MSLEYKKPNCCFVSKDGVDLFIRGLGFHVSPRRTEFQTIPCIVYIDTKNTRAAEKRLARWRAYSAKHPKKFP